MSKADRYSKLIKKKSAEVPQSKESKKKLFNESNHIELKYHETKTKKENETNPHANTETKLQQDDEVNAETKNEVKAELDQDTFTDPASEILSIVESGKKKKRMEDERIRSTYWLLPEERKMVDKLNKLTGLNKYDVVGKAIRSMYERAMQAKQNKKS